MRPMRWVSLRNSASRVFCFNVREDELQADLTMGNVASAITLQSQEAALVEELRAGSEEAFAWLIARYHQPIFSLLARTAPTIGRMPPI